MQCPIDRAQQAMAFDDSVMGTLRGHPGEPRQRQDSTLQSSDREAIMIPLRHRDAPIIINDLLMINDFLGGVKDVSTSADAIWIGIQHPSFPLDFLTDIEYIFEFIMKLTYPRFWFHLEI